MTSMGEAVIYEESPLKGIGELFRAVNDRVRKLEAGWRINEHDFFCECEDERCTRALRMSSDEYQTLRSAPGAYAVLPGHEQITDTVVSHGHQYLIVTNVTALTTGSTEVTGHTIERMRVA